jgi:hypothetical protein
MSWNESGAELMAGAMAEGGKVVNGARQKQAVVSFCQV